MPNKATSPLNKKLKAYFAAQVFQSMAVALPHAVLTVLLFEKGLSISEITFIQSMFSLAIIIAEIPSGVVSDLLSRKITYITSNILLIIFFAIVLLFNSVVFMAVAWFIYGLSVAMSTGTIDATIINEIKNTPHEKERSAKVAKFIRLDNQFMLLAMIVASILGSFIYYNFGIILYAASIFLVIVATAIINLHFSLDVRPDQKQNNIKWRSLAKTHISESLQEIKHLRVLKYALILSVISQVYLQTHFQLWQAIFLEKGLNGKYFFVFYTIFQLITIISIQFPVSKLTSKRAMIFMLAALPIAFTLLYFMIATHDFLFVLCYLFFILLFSVLLYYYNFLYTNHVSQEKISALTSVKSSLTRVTSVITLWITSAMLNIFNVNFVVICNFMIAIVLTTLILIAFEVRKRTVQPFCDNQD